MFFILITLLGVGAKVWATSPDQDLTRPVQPATVPQNKCGPNQEYNECGSSCPPTCASLGASPQSCSDVCVAGCFCKDGYYKDGKGNCVTRDQCPAPVCPRPNEVAKECGSPCEVRSCENYTRTDIACAAVCVRGCFCRDGTVRGANGLCVPIDQCPRQPVCLQENEEYQSCGSSCPDTCDNYKDTDRVCTLNCVPGCNCKSGYVRGPNKTCIKPEQCPPLVCGENETYKQCGTACPLTCDNYKNPPDACTAQCVEGCFCRDGYVKNLQMRCVKPENCEPMCPAGEKFDRCAAHCQDTCENYRTPDRPCTRQCQSGCVCEAGTVRRKDGRCVTPGECPPPVCPANETYLTCGSSCPPTCKNRNDTQRICTQQCVVGCFCNNGLVRADDGTCVAPESCPSGCE